MRIFRVLAAMLVVCLAMGTSEAANPRRRAAGNQRKATTAPADHVYGLRLTAGEGYHNQPAVAQTADGTTWVAWVNYEQATGGDVVQIRGTRHQPRPEVLPTQTISVGPGQYIRPVLAGTGDELWCFWTASQEKDRAAIWCSHLQGGKWSAAERFLPDEKRSHQNPEVAASAGGAVAVVYQQHNGADYDIALREYVSGRWSGVKLLSDAATNDWDPAAAFDSKSKLCVAWTAFADGDYDVYIARPGQSDRPRRISARGEYDLHPWLAAGENGAMWVSWDVVRIRNHGHSGGTTITGANKKRDKSDTDEGNANHWSGVEVRVLDGDAVLVPGKPREEIVAPQGYVLAHRSLGKITITPNGEPWIVYRALMKPIAPWSPNDRDGYLWELLARPYRDGKWGEPIFFNESDGYLEEPAVLMTRNGVKVAYSSEHRHSAARQVDYVTKKPDSGGYDHHHDFDGFLGWHGDVYLATLPLLLPPPLKLSALPAETEIADRPVDPRMVRAAGRHAVESGGKTYQLLWGDTHRHSNVSRCSVGNEPSPEDLYRYGIDIDLYDFLALSDHSEYTTDYYWWRQQKMADLFHIPGVMSILYNSEWSMGFPQGHTNTVMPSRHNVKMNGKIGDTKTLVGGWEMLDHAGVKAITIPHTPADPGMGTAWPSYNPKYLRLCEIFQACRGSYEYDGCPRQHGQATNKQGFYWEALKKGYRLGIICSSDHGYGAAYACVYASENTRDAVWQALYDRRTYGSTAYGLVAEARSGEHWMGEEFSSGDAPKIDVYVRGSAPIRSIEILGRSKVLYAKGSIEQPINEMEHRLSWSDPEWDKLAGEQWYYVRIIQSDDEMAWTSPMWITKR